MRFILYVLTCFIQILQSDVPRPVMVSRERSGFTLNIIDTPGIVEGGYINDQALELIKRSILAFHSYLHKEHLVLVLLFTSSVCANVWLQVHEMAKWAGWGTYLIRPGWVDMKHILSSFCCCCFLKF